MADIPGWAWIITGFFIVGVAAVIGGLGFFILIGCGFIAWGTFKSARDYMLKGQKPRLRPWEKEAISKGHMPPAAGHPTGHGTNTNIYEPVTGIRAMEMHDELREHAPTHQGRHADKEDSATAWRHTVEQRAGTTSGHNVRAIPCPTCKTQVWSNAHFCHFCGAQLKHPGR